MTKNSRIRDFKGVKFWSSKGFSALSLNKFIFFFDFLILDNIYFIFLATHSFLLEIEKYFYSQFFFSQEPAIFSSGCLFLLTGFEAEIVLNLFFFWVVQKIVADLETSL